MAVDRLLAEHVDASMESRVMAPYDTLRGLLPSEGELLRHIGGLMTYGQVWRRVNAYNSFVYREPSPFSDQQIVTAIWKASQGGVLDQ